MHTETRVVDDRTFLLGLDELYRRHLRVHERGELLDCARRLCADLDLAPAQGPVEGCYVEEPELSEYFQRMRALQDLEAGSCDGVTSNSAFSRLREVTASPLFGDSLPAPGAGHAAEYWAAAKDNEVAGRCVRLGYDDTIEPLRHYHWALVPRQQGLEAVEFWSEELWTTERFREALLSPEQLPSAVVLG